MTCEQTATKTEAMATPEDTFTKPRSDSADYKNYKTPSLASNKITLDNDDRDDWKENMSSSTMKNLYSVDRLSLDVTNTKSDLQNLRNSEKFDKNSKILRNSSIMLEKETVQTEFDELVKQSFSPQQWYGKAGSDLFACDASSMKKFAVGKYIEENPKSADLKWSLFCAACHSYRYDFVLRPFPPMFIKEDVKDIDKLRDVAESCPSMNVLHNQIEDKTCDMLSADLINLLYWVLICVKEPQLKFIPKEKHGGILAKVVSSSISTAPHYIFQVVHTRCLDQQKFSEYTKTYKTIHAFHGSRLDNFYSILNYGLRISFNKLSANGPGIYLSSEMNVSLPYSQSGFSWGGSYFGSQISLVALCEMIDHPDVKYADEKKAKKKSKFVPDLDSVPQKYFVVTNSDLIRVKYLLLFSDSIPESSGYQLSMITTWLQRNKVIAVVIAYVILLLAIATSHNSTTYKFYRRMMRRLGFRV